MRLVDFPLAVIVGVFGSVAVWALAEAATLCIIAGPHVAAVFLSNFMLR